PRTQMGSWWRGSGSLLELCRIPSRSVHFHRRQHLTLGVLERIMPKYVYFFGGKTADGTGKQKELLSGKGANLVEMCRIGLPVPAGFTITTEVCTYYYANNKTYPKELKGEVDEALAKTEKEMGAKFGDPKNPLLVSCRSGARVSMPGMMDTVLNIG